MKYKMHLVDIENRIKWQDSEKPVTKEELAQFFDKVQRDKRLSNDTKSHLLFKIKSQYKLLNK